MDQFICMTRGGGMDQFICSTRGGGMEQFIYIKGVVRWISSFV